MSVEPDRGEPAAMPPYEVVCIEMGEGDPTRHAHVTAVTTRDPDGGETTWSFAQVIAGLLSGERFVVPAATGRESATLTHGICPDCSVPQLQTNPIEALELIRRC